RPELLPDLERDPPRGARRLRARLLPRLPDRSRRLHRRLLQESGLGRRERLGVEEPDPAALTRCPPLSSSSAATCWGRCRSATGSSSCSRAKTSARSAAATSA